jgi:AcrR family transcriptional regulator
VSESAIGHESGEGQGALTRAAIAETARAMFTENGYAGTSVRAIAAAAGIDPALVIRYFGSKERLFQQTVQMPGFLEQTLVEPVEDLGERIVAALFSGDVDTRLSVFSALMRAADSDAIRKNVQESAELTFIEPLVRLLEGPDLRLRARLIGAQINGLMTILALEQDGELATADRQVLITTYGRAVQALIQPPPPPPS